MVAVYINSAKKRQAIVHFIVAQAWLFLKIWHDFRAIPAKANNYVL